MLRAELIIFPREGTRKTLSVFPKHCYIHSLLREGGLYTSDTQKIFQYTAYKIFQNILMENCTEIQHRIIGCHFGGKTICCCSMPFTQIHRTEKQGEKSSGRMAHLTKYPVATTSIKFA